MADKEKKVAQNSDVEKATTDESTAAKKVAKAAKGNADKKNKPNFFVRSGKGIKRFFKDFKGECKKIVWPDAKTVLKSTGIVLLVVLIVGLIVFGIDQALTAGVGGLKELAIGETTTVASDETAGEDEHDHDHDGETTEKTDATTEAAATSEAEDTTAEKTTEDTTAEKTDE